MLENYHSEENESKHIAWGFDTPSQEERTRRDGDKIDEVKPK